MTTPDVNIDIDLGPMPYGVNATALGTTYFTLSGAPDRIDGSFIKLEPGPCIVQASWPGTPDAYIRWVDAANTEKGRLEIPAGGGVQSANIRHWSGRRRQTSIPHSIERNSWYHGHGHGISNPNLKAVV